MNPYVPRPPQGELFDRAALPRQLPILKSGPEDELTLRAPRTQTQH